MVSARPTLGESVISGHIEYVCVSHTNIVVHQICKLQPHMDQSDFDEGFKLSTHATVLAKVLAII